MARVLALVPDLLFGSRVQSTLQGAGHEVELIATEAVLRERLHEGGVPSVVVVDLTAADLDGPGLVQSLSQSGELQGARTLGFYAHVDAEVRRRAEAAGFDRVVPRSRMAREAAELVAALVEQAPPALR
jgi:CheY-like chemotaxis protein